MRYSYVIRVASYVLFLNNRLVGALGREDTEHNALIKSVNPDTHAPLLDKTDGESQFMGFGGKRSKKASSKLAKSATPKDKELTGSKLSEGRADGESQFMGFGGKKSKKAFSKLAKSATPKDKELTGSKLNDGKAASPNPSPSPFQNTSSTPPSPQLDEPKKSSLFGKKTKSHTNLKKETGKPGNFLSRGKNRVKAFFSGTKKENNLTTAGGATESEQYEQRDSETKW